MLQQETTIEFTFNRPFMHYCQEHECLRVADSSGDGLLLNGLKEEHIDEFIELYNKYVKKSHLTVVPDNEDV